MPRTTRRKPKPEAAQAEELPKRRSNDSSDDAQPPKRIRTTAPSNAPRRLGLMGNPDNAGRAKAISDEEFLKNVASMKVTLKKKKASQLKPEKMHFHEEENRENHNTYEYFMESLIVRRGQEFKLTVTFDRPYDAKQDKFILQLTFGNRPQESKHSLIRVKESKTLNKSSWGMRIDSCFGNHVSVTVMSPASALVGEYSVYVETKTKKSGSDEEYLTYRKKLDDTFVVLFNAWCKDDAVYMEGEEERQEYVLNDHGRIWVGSQRNFSGIPWYFGQFEEVALTACLKVLDLSKLGNGARGNATQVCRAISQMANDNDDDGGILEGRWTATYPKDCVEPTVWTGSVDILKRFSRKHKAVRYGQCWVFSGLVTTLLRAIGIPTRSVTNFESAHDTDASMTIDFHSDKDGNPLDDLNDSVWNFHVWNESFFVRPDLPPGYGGWQAHDATPQETSEGVFRCGPCPVRAIKEGEVYLPYDGSFIFGEVNGDRVYWEVDEDGEMTPVYIDTSCIGKSISTKAVGSNNREDLTWHYKYPEGSYEERRTVTQANKFSSRRDENIYRQLTARDVEFKASVSDSVAFGSDVDVELLVKNTSKEKRTVYVAIVTKMAFYTGITARNLEQLYEVVNLNAKQEKTVKLTVPADSYLNKTAADACIKAYFKARVHRTGQIFSGIDTVEFQKPDLLFTIPENISSNETFEVKLFVKNQLPVKLTNCVFNVESSRYVTPDTLTLRVRHPVKPNEEAVAIAVLKATRGGKRTIDVSFKSDQLTGVRGEIDFEVARN